MVLNSTFGRYIVTLQMTEYSRQPRIHLVKSSNRLIAVKSDENFIFYARFFPEGNFQLSTEVLSCLPKN